MILTVKTKETPMNEECYRCGITILLGERYRDSIEVVICEDCAKVMEFPASEIKVRYDH